MPRSAGSATVAMMGATGHRRTDAAALSRREPSGNHQLPPSAPARDRLQPIVTGLLFRLVTVLRQAQRKRSDTIPSKRPLYRFGCLQPAGTFPRSHHLERKET